MTTLEYLEILKQGVKIWNEWRGDFPDDHPDLKGVNLINARLGGINLFNADLSGADLSGADLSGADLCGANLCGANLNGTFLNNAKMIGTKMIGTKMIGAKMMYACLICAYSKNAKLMDATLENADLSGAELIGADLSGANLSRANLSGTNLEGAILINAKMKETNMSGANFSLAMITGCEIYGISAWNLNLENTIQKDLIISNDGEPVITVDNLAIAQFIYLLLNNKNIRDVLNSITSKGVLILGRFADPQRKAVLDGLREKLRDFDLLPIVFDFDCPTDKDYTETVQTLVGMCMFVIADITNPKSVPLELEAMVKHFKIPYVPIIDIIADPRPFAMLVDSQNSFHWVLPTLKYETMEDLLDDKNLKEYVIDPVNKKRAELIKAKNSEPKSILIRKKD